MSCSTSIDVGGGSSAPIRQRSCARSACCSPSPSPARRCCDDNCLVEIARRDCKSEHSRLALNSSTPSPADEEPCESHLSKAKAAYSEMLNNIGCICKVLLSLNLESCCTKEGGAARYEAPEKRGLLAEMRRVSSERRSMKSAGGGSCEGNSGYSPPSDEEEQLATLESPTMTGDCASKGCCTKPPHASQDNTRNTEKATCASGMSKSARNDLVLNDDAAGSCSTSTCCIKPVVEASGKGPNEFDCRIEDQDSADECGKECCPESAIKPSIAATKKDCGKGCCSEEEKDQIVITQPEDDCAKGCCSGPVSTLSFTEKCKSPMDSCCSSKNPAGIDSKCGAGTTSKDIEILPYDQTPDGDTGNQDLEKGAFEVEHLLISVQGMTCTGCEKSLSKALNSMPAVFNIKTSLVLGRAEFDLRTLSSHNSVAETIKTLQKMTGFTCSKMTLSGHELDLIVGDPSLFLGDRDLPYGISDITILDSHTIRVVYHPEVIGGRDLIGSPFFESVTLAPMADPPLISSGRAQLRLMLFKTLISTILTIPVLVLSWADLPPREIAYGAASLVLATIVQIYIAGPWYVSAFKALFFSHMVEVDFLVVLSTSTAYIYSIIAYAFLASEKPLSSGSFFETSTLLVTLIMVGRLVTSFARQRAVESISIESLQPSTAILFDPKSGSREEIDARLLQYGDMFVVLPDSSIATDGTVISGVSDVDESMITGEATLVAKQPGSPIVAGSINHSGSLIVRLTRLMGDNTIKTIGLMVDEAKSSRARFQDMADRVASYFVPVILVVTVIVFVTWVGVGKGVREYPTSKACINAMTYAISALIVSCPCAIGLAVPMVLVIAGGVAAKHGVIFKSAETIEKARNVSHVVFDKTGTLTQGLLAVETEIYPTGEGRTLGPMILGLTSSSKHPVSIAIVAHLKSTITKPDELKNVTSIPGCGIEATWGEENIRAGNPYWLGVENLPAVKNVLSLGVTVFCITVNKGVVAVYGLKDSLRSDTIAIVKELKQRGIEISIVSGDNEASVKSVSQILEVPETHVRFRCSPGDKQTYIKEISTEKNIVMFCGDGTNDAVALAQADVGVHVNGGTDIAQSAADAVLVRPALSGIIVLIDLSKAFYGRVVFNFTWSFVYNTFAILLAAGAFPNARIPPQYAGLGEIVSVLPVIAVGVQLRWVKFTNVKA